LLTLSSKSPATKEAVSKKLNGSLDGAPADEASGERQERFMDLGKSFVAHSTTMEIIEVLCRAVISNPSVDLGFEHHAASVGVSVRTLSRLFTRELGLGFAEWRRQVQLTIALSKLAEGQTVSSVARSLGYLPSSFTDMFRRELGTPPSEFRPDETPTASGDATPPRSSRTGWTTARNARLFGSPRSGIATHRFELSCLRLSTPSIVIAANA
jgi:AraC-like DNA-binding protein